MTRHPGFIRRALLAACVAVVPAAELPAAEPSAETRLQLNELEYLEMPGLNVMLAHDYYPEGHQGGVGIIQNGLRVATNGDLRLEPHAGPVAARAQGRRARRGPEGRRDQRAARVPRRREEPEGLQSDRLPRPAFRLHGAGAAGRRSPSGSSSTSTRRCRTRGSAASASTSSCFPGSCSARRTTGRAVGLFPRQANGPGALDAASATTSRSRWRPAGNSSSRPNRRAQRMTIDDVAGGELELARRPRRAQQRLVRRAGAGAEGRGERCDRVAGHTACHPRLDVRRRSCRSRRSATIPKQPKIAVIELDAHDARRPPVALSARSRRRRPREGGRGQPAGLGPLSALPLPAASISPRSRKPGMYVVSYGDARIARSRSAPTCSRAHVWQPTLEYFLPVQMCHMRVTDQLPRLARGLSPRRRAHGAGQPQPFRRLPRRGRRR